MLDHQDSGEHPDGFPARSHAVSSRSGVRPGTVNFTDSRDEGRPLRSDARTQSSAHITQVNSTPRLSSIDRRPGLA